MVRIAEDKLQLDFNDGVLLGAGIEGVVGRIGVPRCRRITLAEICLRLGVHGFATAHLLDSVTGLVNSSFLCRRPLLAVLDSMCGQSLLRDHTIIQLVSATCDELCLAVFYCWWQRRIFVLPICLASGAPTHR